MKIIDLHQDLLLHIRFRDRIGQHRQTDFEMLEKSTVDTVIATAFPFPANNDQANPIVNDLITEELQMYTDYCEENLDWMIVKSKTDFTYPKKKLILHIEGLNVFSGTKKDWDRLENWYKLGLRSLGTHWNINNPLGGGTLDPDLPLTDLGREVIEWTEKKSILLDFAHMGSQTFMDAAKQVNRPIYVSHGNSNKICLDVRNYTDEQLKMIAETDGVIGAFFAGSFVSGRQRKSTIGDVIAHITHIKKLIGMRHIGIGSDFGGVLANPVEGLCSVSDFAKLETTLSENGFNDSELEDLCFNNARRIIETHMQKSS